MSVVSYEEKRYLEKALKLLDNVEYNEILKIMIKNNQKYSTNKTGVFFNLKYIEDVVLREIINFVNFCIKNRENFKLEPNASEPQNIKKENNKYIKNSDEGGNGEEKEYFKKKFEFTLESKLLNKDLDKFKSRNNKELKFSFKNYLDKISIINNKEFENDGHSYPTLNQHISNFEGVSDRIFKKCKNIDRSGIQNDNNEKILETDII